MSEPVSDTFRTSDGRTHTLSVEGAFLRGMIYKLTSSIERSLGAANENFAELHAKVDEIIEKHNQQCDANHAYFTELEGEIDRVFALIEADVKSLADDNKILHEVINDIDEEKGELEDRVVKLEKDDQLEISINAGGTA